MANLSLKNIFTTIFFTEILLLIASFISFPVFARLLSKSDYGFMSLVTMSLMVVNCFCSGGLNNSVLRFFELYKNSQRIVFVNTIRLSTAFLSIVGVFGYILLAFCLLGFGQINSTELAVIIGASFLIIVRALTKIELSFLRVSNNVLIMNIFNLIIKYVGIAACICLVYKFNSLFWFYLGMFFAEFGVIVAIYAYIIRKTINFDVKVLYDKKIAHESFSYGVPLALTSFLAVFNGGVDRYLIGYLLGVEFVADYTVATSYCSYPMEVLKNVYAATFIPLIMNSWSSSCCNDGNKMLSKYFGTYALFSFPIAVGLSMVDNEGIRFLAGQKYSAIPTLIPLLACGYLLSGLNFLSVSGLLFRKKTKAVLFLTLFVGIMSVCLNLVFVPRYGLIGAAVVIVICNATFFVVGSYFSRKELHYKIPFNDIVLSMTGAGFMGFILFLLSFIEEFDQLLAKILIGCVSYGLFLVIFGGARVRGMVGSFVPKKVQLER